MDITSDRKRNQVERPRVRAANSRYIWCTLTRVDALWEKIRQHAGEPFRQRTGKEFTYQVSQSALRPSTTNWNIPRKDFERASLIAHLETVSQVQKLGVQGPSYVFAILTDSRIREPQISPTVITSTEEEGKGADSPEQRRAEDFIVASLGESLGTILQSQTIRVEAGCTVQIDGASSDLTILCEAWAHQGRPKTAQKHKVMADAMKLIFVGRQLKTSPRLVLAFSDPNAAAHFIGRSWMAKSLAHNNIEIRVIELPADLRESLITAQLRQGDNNRRKVAVRQA